MRIFSGAALAAVFSLISAAGCHSYHIDTTIENQTGEPLQLLEVDYPSASFGKDSMSAGEEYRYRIQIRGSGKLKISYTTRAGKAVQIEGPDLIEGQEGRLEIVLLSRGKADFQPQLTPGR
jgi:hypothetical protein